MKIFCDSLREHALKIINFKKKKWIKLLKKKIISKQSAEIIWKFNNLL